MTTGGGEMTRHYIRFDVSCTIEVAVDADDENAAVTAAKAALVGHIFSGYCNGWEWSRFDSSPNWPLPLINLAGEEIGTIKDIDDEQKEATA